MKLSEVKKALEDVDGVKFRLPDGNWVPARFHVTEVGCTTKNFIDCGGTVREERTVNFQLWTSTDEEHRLKPEKLRRIISLSEKELGIGDHEVEVEYQGQTIEKYGLAFADGAFQLLAKQTACLAEDKCGIAVPKSTLKLADLRPKDGRCAPGDGCC